MKNEQKAFELTHQEFISLYQSNPKPINNEEKAKEIKKEFEQYGCECVPNDCYVAALKMAQWKDEQLIEYLAAFAQHLNKRGAFRDDLCMDFGHEAQSFIELQKFKESMKGNKQ